jgi:tryptophan halogenase
MNIVICGGGTAGWLSAFIISQTNPYQHDITVVESSKIGIIGAGEASSGLIVDILSGNFFYNNKKLISDQPEIDILDFIDKTDGVPKYALKHINWAKDKGSYFAPVVGSITTKNSPDYLFNYVISEYGLDKAHLATATGQAYELNKFPVTKDYGLHFDAFKVGKYIKDYLVKYYNVKCVDSIIKNVNIGSNENIDNLTLEDDLILDGDFFVDCTGMQRLLANKLDIAWESYKKYLPVDRAMPFILEHDESKKIQPATEAEALSSGWMWRTDLSSRKGCGYVYSSDFISEDQAQVEAEKIIGKPIQPIKHLKFDSGRLVESWKKNCLITGLASSFVEPLEATSIHATIAQVYSFCIEHLTNKVETTVTESNIKSYNKNITRMHENLLDFTVLHYQGGRDDSNFWRYIKNEKLVTSTVDNYIEKAKSRIPTFIYMPAEHWVANDLWKWSLAGLGLIDRDLAREELIQFDMYDYARSHYEFFRDSVGKDLSNQFLPFELDLNNPMSFYVR